MTTGRNLAKSLQLEQDTHAISIDYSPLNDFPAFSFASLRMNTIALTHEDALLIVDAQNDFLSGGNLAVPAGNEVIPALNGCIELFSQQSLPIFATRDWHPADHCSFQSQGGTWPSHCVAGSAGAAFPSALHLPGNAVIVSKATSAQKDAYSGFEGTDLTAQLRQRGIRQLFIGGLATDYCVLRTVTDALSNGFKVVLLLDAIRAVDLCAGDGQAAIEEMIKCGARPARATDICGLASGMSKH